MICEKCKAQAFSTVRAKIVNKYGVQYPYLRYVHYDKRKKSKRRYCYMPAKESKVSAS